MDSKMSGIWMVLLTFSVDTHPTIGGTDVMGLERYSHPNCQYRVSWVDTKGVLTKPKQGVSWCSILQGVTGFTLWSFGSIAFYIYKILNAFGIRAPTVLLWLNVSCFCRFTWRCKSTTGGWFCDQQPGHTADCQQSGFKIFSRKFSFVSSQQSGG